jgi:two-component system NtrC family sensor kinase
MRTTLLNFAFYLLAMLKVSTVVAFSNASIVVSSDFDQFYLKETGLSNLKDSLSATLAEEGGGLVWKQFQVNVSDQSSTFYLGSNQYETIQLFQFQEGALIQIEEMDYPLVSFFKLQLPMGEHSLVIGLNSRLVSKLPTVQIPLQLLSPKAFDWQYGYAWIFGIFFLGATFLLGLFHFVLFAVTRDWSYLFYFSFIICATFFCLSMNPPMAKLLYGGMQPTSGIPFFVGTLTLALHLALFKNIFDLGTLYPGLDIWFKRAYFLIGAFAVVGLLGFTYVAVIFLFPLTAVAAAFMIWVNIRFLRGMSMLALLFLLGTASFSFSIFLLLSMLLEWLPSAVLGMTVGLQMQVFYLLGTIFWAAALSARISNMRKAANEKELETRTLKRKQEQELLKMLEEQNKELEERVQNRTKKVQEKNRELETSIQSLHAAQNQLIEKEKMVSLGQLTAGVAHEINNPINFISNGISNLKLNYQDLVDALRPYLPLLPENTSGKQIMAIKEQNQKLEIAEIIEENKILFKSINNGVDRTRKIVNSLSTFSEEGGEQYVPTDLNACLESTLEILKNKIKNRIEVVKEYGDLPKVVCQESRINQVFLNILNNAAQAIEGNGVINIQTSDDESMVQVKITDNGSGMDEATRRKVFDPFFTTKEIGVGTGLGLSISYKIIEQHGGSIHLESKLGKGTTFFILLPVKKENP